MGRNYFPKSNIHVGFTLIELLVAVAIIGVLASSLFFVLNPGEQIAKGRDAQRKSDLEQIKNALDLYYNDNNKYPEGENGLVAGIPWGEEWPSAVSEQPYMVQLPKDPISGKSYRYEAPADGTFYRLFAELERCSDAQITPGSSCDSYNYSVTSTNTTIVAYGAPTPTPFLFPTVTPTPTPTLSPKRVFAVSGGGDGDKGGLTGADAQCNSRASAAGLGGIWVAWLSTSDVDAKNRVPDRKYTLVDTVTIVANNKADLIDGTLQNPINKNEYGNPVSGDIWTGTKSDGTKHTDTCADWTSTGSIGRRGSFNYSDSRWTEIDSLSCSIGFSMYCFEQ